MRARFLIGGSFRVVAVPSDSIPRNFSTHSSNRLASKALIPLTRVVESSARAVTPTPVTARAKDNAMTLVRERNSRPTLLARRPDYLGGLPGLRFQLPAPDFLPFVDQETPGPVVDELLHVHVVAAGGGSTADVEVRAGYLRPGRALR